AGELFHLRDDVTHGRRSGDYARPRLRSAIVLEGFIKGRALATRDHRAAHDEARACREHCRLDPPTADVNAISRAEVFDEKAPLLCPDSAMALAHRAVVDANVGLFARAENKRLSLAQDSLHR